MSDKINYTEKRSTTMPRDTVESVKPGSTCYLGFSTGFTCHKTGIDLIIVARSHEEARRFVTAYSEPTDYDAKVTHPVLVMKQGDAKLGNDL